MMARVASEVITEEWWRDFMQVVVNLHKGYQVEHDCPECSFRKKVTVQIPDFKGIMDAVTEVYNQCFGRPGTADSDPGGTTIILKRTWPGGDDAASDPVLPAGGDAVSADRVG